MLEKANRKTLHYYFIFLDIDENDLLSPLLVVQTLSNNESTTLDLLKVTYACACVISLIFPFEDYLIRKLRTEQEQIDRGQTDIAGYRQESDSILKKIKKLETESVTKMECLVTIHGVRLV